MRVAARSYRGPQDQLGAALQELIDYAERHSVGPCGPPAVAFAHLPDEGDVTVELRVPLCSLGPDEGAIRCRLLPRRRVRVAHFQGRLGPGLRQAHETLLASLELVDGAFEQAWLGTGGLAGEWSLEIRVELR